MVYIIVKWQTKKLGYIETRQYVSRVSKLNVKKTKKKIYNYHVKFEKGTKQNNNNNNKNATSKTKKGSNVKVYNDIIIRVYIL